MKKFIVALYAISIVLTFQACDPGEKYKAELSKIESSLKTLDSIEQVLSTVPQDSIARLFKKVKQDMELIQTRYTGNMPKELGVNLSRYRDIPNHIKHYSDVKGGIEEGISFSRKQLTALQEAILEGANRDARGNTINEEYIQKNCETETKMVEDIVQQVEKVSTGGKKAFQDYEQYYPLVNNVLDSLKSLD
jgi:hypothetical protein